MPRVDNAVIVGPRRFTIPAVIGAAVVLMLVLIAIGADVLAPYGVNATEGRIAESPSSSHWLGTDNLGKDVLSRVMFGSRLSLICGALSVALAIGLGTPLGTLAGYFGGWVDSICMRTIDIFLAFPSVLIALLIASAIRPGWTTVIIAVALLNVPMVARQIRATVLTVRSLDYVAASRALGASPLRTLVREILPAIVGPLIALASLGIGAAILETAGLAFLGIGGDPTEPEWGSMLAGAKDYWSKNPWAAVGPGAAISITVLGCNLLGDAVHAAREGGRRKAEGG